MPDGSPRPKVVRWCASLVVVAIAAAGAVAGSAAASAAPATDHTGSNVAAEKHRPSAVAPTARETTIQVLRRVTGGHRELVAAVIAFVVLAGCAAIRLGRTRDPVRSRQLLHSIVRGRSPPPLQTVR